MTDNPYIPKIGSYRGVEIRKAAAFAEVPALYYTGMGASTSLNFAIFLIDQRLGPK